MLNLCLTVYFKIVCYFFRSANKDTLHELQVEADMYKTQLLEQKQQLREEKRYKMVIVITFLSTLVLRYVVFENTKKDKVSLHLSHNVQSWSNMNRCFKTLRNNAHNTCHIYIAKF